MDEFNLVTESALDAEDHIVVVDGLQDVLNQQLNAQVIGQLGTDGQVSLVDGANWPGNVMYILNRESADDHVVEAQETVVNEDNVTLIEIKSVTKTEQEKEEVVMREEVVEEEVEKEEVVASGMEEKEVLTEVVSVEPPEKPSEEVSPRMRTRSKAKGASYTRTRYSSINIVNKTMKSTPEPKKRLRKKVASKDNKGTQIGTMDPLEGIALAWYKQRRLCDVTLISGEEEIEAHSLVLAAFSGLFHTMLTTESDSQHRQLSLDHLKLAPGCLEVLVNFMYTRKMKLNATHRLDLIFAAGMLSMEAATEELVGPSKLADSNAQWQRVTESNRAETLQMTNVGVIAVQNVDVIEDECEEEDDRIECEEEMEVKEEEKEEEEEEQPNDAVKAEVDLVIDTIMAAVQPAEEPEASDKEDENMDINQMRAMLNVDLKPVEEGPVEEGTPEKVSIGRPQKNGRFHQLKGVDGRYHCDFKGCDYSSVPLCNLVRHYRKHSDEKPHTCPKCGKSFKLKKYLSDHELTHSEERRFGCEICGAQFRCDKHLHRHQKIHSVVRTFFLCQICNEKKFKTEELLQKHISRVHLKEKTHPCTEEGCTYKAFSQSQLRNHCDIRHCEIREAILCDTCGKSFLSEQSMRNHTLAVHEERFFHCPHCPYKSGFRTGITSHIKRKHGLTLDGSVATPNYSCDRCEFTCFTKHEFTRHMRNHTGEKPFKCPFCEFATVEKMNLTFHLRTHTGEKPHECEICHRKFPRTLGLQRHMLVHSGQKPHKCGQCSMAYADKRSLESHQYSTHLQIKPFLCGHCTYACIRRENLNRHMKRCHPVTQELKMDDSLLAVKQESKPPVSDVTIEASQQLQQVYANQLGGPINLVFGPDHQLDTVQLVLQQQQQ